MLLTRPLVTAGISFLITALVVSFFSLKVSVAVLICFIILMLIGIIVFKGKDKIGMMIILLSGIVAVSSYMFYVNFKEYDLSRFGSQSGNITGIVTDIAPSRNSKTAFTIEITDTDIKDMPTGFKGILYAKSDTVIDFYDTIKIEAKANKITSSPAFDFERYYRSIGISMTFSSYNQATVVKKGSHGLMYYAKRLNVQCCNIIDRYVERPYAGLMKAMLLGNDYDIDDTVYNKIVRAGVSHIFVVSGLHVSLLTMLLFFILKLLKLSLRARSIVAIFASWGFVAITGFGIPAIRAAIMLTVLMGANLFRRPADSLTSLFLAGIIIVLINPIAIINASFLLTFTATLGIILLYRPISNCICLFFNAKRKIVVNIINIISLTFAANIAMLPVIIYTFKGISVAAPITNLLVIPILPFVLTIGILLLLLSGFSAVGTFLGAVIKFLLSFIVKSCEILSSSNFSYIGLNYNFVYVWLTITIILIVAAIIFIRKKRAINNVLFISFAGLMLCLFFNGIYNRDNVEIATLNTFEGQSVVVTYNKRGTVISLSDDSRIDVDVENYLRSKNIHSVENYIFAFSDKKDITDTEYLSKTMGIYNIFMFQNDRLLTYAKDLFNPTIGVYGLKSDGGYDIFNFKGTKMSVDRFDSDILISLFVGKTRIAITNSYDIASKADCEILFYCGQYNEKLTQINSKCVILLNRFKLGRLADKIKSINAYEKQVCLSLRQTGTYKMGV